MAFDPTRVFTQSSGKVAAILCIVAVIGVLAVFAKRMFGYQDKFPGGPPLMGNKDGMPPDDKDKGQNHD